MRDILGELYTPNYYPSPHCAARSTFCLQLRLCTPQIVHVIILKVTDLIARLQINTLFHLKRSLPSIPNTTTLRSAS